MIRIAVLGSPIAHSKSPVIQSAALKHLGHESSFAKIDLPSNLTKWLWDQGSNWDALAVTMPLKEEALIAAETIDDVARETGSTNFLVRTAIGFKGYNTDVMGLRSATNHLSFDKVGIVGTGATARSALTAFSDKDRLVWGREMDKANTLADRYGASTASLDAVLDCELVVVTLPKGVFPSLASGSRHGTVLDAVYAQPFSPNFQRHISGLEMLIWQAIGQLRILLNSSKPFDDEQLMHDFMLRAAEMEE
jgi:shikimate dehydrogenase